MAEKRKIALPLLSTMKVCGERAVRPGHGDAGGRLRQAEGTLPGPNLLVTVVGVQVLQGDADDLRRGVPIDKGQALASLQVASRLPFGLVDLHLLVALLPGGLLHRPLFYGCQGLLGEGAQAVGAHGHHGGQRRAGHPCILGSGARREAGHQGSCSVQPPKCWAATHPRARLGGRACRSCGDCELCLQGLGAAALMVLGTGASPLSPAPHSPQLGLAALRTGDKPTRSSSALGTWGQCPSALKCLLGLSSRNDVASACKERENHNELIGPRGLHPSVGQEGVRCEMCLWTQRMG